MGDEMVRELAREAFGALEVAERSDGEPCVRVRESAPDWVRVLVRIAHSGMLPDDWRHEAIRQALSWIADGDPTDEPDRFAAEHADVYDVRLIRWLGSHPERVAHVDDALEELGGRVDSIMDAVRSGQMRELEEVCELVAGALEERAEELEAERAEA